MFRNILNKIFLLKLVKCCLYTLSKTLLNKFIEYVSLISNRYGLRKQVTTFLIFFTNLTVLYIVYFQYGGTRARCNGRHDRWSHVSDGHRHRHHVHAPVPHHRHHGPVAEHLAYSQLRRRCLGRAHSTARTVNDR